MNDAALAPNDAQAGMTVLLALGATSTTTPPAFLHGPADTEAEVSIAGVMLLSAMSVLMAILGMISFALFVVACWWVISHVPVPWSVHLLLARLHLA